MKNSTSTIQRLSPDVADVASISGAVTTVLAGFDSDGEPLVDVAGESGRTRVRARSCTPLQAVDVGKQVIVIPDAGNPDSPIVIGVIQTPSDQLAIELTADGKGLVLQAEQSILLKCGGASITLQRDGRVVIRGKHIVTHASGVNRIRGGSVQLN